MNRKALEQEIVAVLKLSPGPLTLKQIYEMIRERGLEVHRMNVISILTTLVAHERVKKDEVFCLHG